MPMRIWLWLSRTSTADRVGEGSSPRSSASPVSISEKLREVGTPSASSISVARISRTPPFKRQPPVAEAAVRRLARPLGAEVHQPAVAVAQLREQEAAPVADIGIVHAELMPVIAQRERLLAACRAAARSVRNARSIRRRSACRARPPPPRGRCGSAGASAGNRPPRRDRRTRRPARGCVLSGR